MNNLITLDEKEYFYLNERFDIMSESDVSQLPRYIVTARIEKLRAIIGVAIDNELDETQREYVIDRYYNSLNISQIAGKHSVPRQKVYRVLDSAQKKLYRALRYAYYCGFSLVEPIQDFDALFNTVKKETNNEDNQHTD